MFSNSFQSGFISIFYSVGSNPLSLWDKQVKNGHIRRVIDDEVKSLVLEISGTNVATTYITCPIKPRASLGIKLPFLVMIIKNMKKYFTFEIQILDDKDMHRRFRVSNFQSTTKVRPFCTTMPIGLSSGWNQVQFNLADFTKRAYGSTYLETMRVQVHANVRIRRLYFTDTLYSDEDMPNEFKLFGPVNHKKKQPEPKLSKDPAKEPPSSSLAPKTEDKPIEEVPPPPSPAEVLPDKETELIAEEEAHPSEIGEAPPQEDVEAQAQQQAREGETIAEKEGVVPTEGETTEETSKKDEAIEETNVTESSEATEGAAPAADTEKPVEETTEEPSPTGETSPTEEPTTEEPPTTEEQPITEEPTTTEVTEEPETTAELTEPVATDVATSESTATDEPANEPLTETENE